MVLVMPDAFRPSEFGGRVKPNRVQPLPHQPTTSEALMLGYTTGDPTGALGPDQGENMTGLLPRRIQEDLRRQAGDLDKGQAWEAIIQEAGQG